MQRKFFFGRRQDTPDFHLFTDADEREVLRAIAIASFALAKRADRETTVGHPELKPADVDAFMTLEAAPGSCVLALGELYGHVCETFLYRPEPGHFILATERFRLRRGQSPVPVLRAAGGSQLQGLFGDTPLPSRARSKENERLCEVYPHTVFL